MRVLLAGWLLQAAHAVDGDEAAVSIAGPQRGDRLAQIARREWARIESEDVTGDQR